MDVPADFKFDVRIRNRLLNKGVVTEAEVEKRLEGLVDVEASSDPVTLSQPAIGTPESRPAPRPIFSEPRAMPAPRSIPPVPLPVDEGWDEDDDDDDDDDIVPKAKAAPKPAEPKPVVPAAVPVAAAA